MRFHLCAAFYVFWAAVICKTSRAETALLALTVGLVIALEAANTAVENCVDLVTDKYSHLAKAAKDTAAGAVLAAALAAVGVGAAIFADADRPGRLLGYFCASPVKSVLLIVSAGIWIWFVFFAGIKEKSTNTKKERYDE